MPPPISPDWSDISHPDTNTRRQPRSRFQYPVYPWVDHELLNTTTQVPTEERLPELFIVPSSSQESDSDDLSISLTESLSSEQRFTTSSALAAFRRRYGELQLENADDVIARALTSSDDDHLFDSEDYMNRIGFEVRNYATNSESDDTDTTDDSATQHENATQSDENSDALGSGPEFLTLARISSIARRLLLSSARQNPTIENIIDMRQIHNLFEDPFPFSSAGVTLTRQNAIRGTSSSLLTTFRGPKIDTLRKNMRRLLRAIKAADDSLGTSPLFNDFHVWNDELFPASRYCCPQHEDLFLESEMGSLLLARDLSRRHHKTRQLEQETRRSPIKKQLKRKCSFDSSPSKKRKRVGHCMGIKEKDQTHMMHILGESISGNHLSDSNKDQILKGLPSSYLQSGSTFIVNLCPSRPAPLDAVELTFSEVSRETSLLNGFFKPIGIDSKENIHLLREFMLTLAGNAGMEDSYSFQDVLCDVFEELQEFYQKHGSSKTDSQIRIPFTGNLVDFQKKDLRFLEDKKDLNSHAKNDRILFQMGEWLKVKPFSHLSETFFLKQLRFGIRSLRNFSEIPKRHQKEMYEFCKNIIDQSSLLTKDFELIHLAKIPIIEKSFFAFEKDSSGEVRDGKCPRLGESPFMRKWNSEVCGKLGEFACCADSCLLNLQLNYVLFTVDVDLHITMDLILRTVSKILPETFAKQLLRKWHEYGKEGKNSTKVGKSTLICSIDRKTGRLELLKTRSEAEFKIPFSRRRFTRERRHSVTNDVPISPSLNTNGFQRRRDSIANPFEIRENRLMRGIPKKGSPVASFGETNGEYHAFV